jgi:hypothetical protein
MAVNPTPPATAAKSSFLLMPILSLPRLNHTIAALACLPVMCVASYAVGIANPFSLAGSAISAYSQESDYTTDYAPKSNRTVILRK